ncbi:MAG: agmatinase family protein [Xanthomonadales bacterium]|nr:agmatinase family protein [Xanthomonadales bacterium]
MNPRRMLSRSTLISFALAMLLAPFDSGYAEWKVPADLAGKLAGLSEDQREFIESGAALDFLPERQLVHELTTQEESNLQSFVADVMSLAEEMGYNPQRDMGAIPLNLTALKFSGGMVPTPAPLREAKREPGPFSVQRYVFPESGVATFAGAKVAIWPEDLVAGQVHVAIIGVPHDMSSGRRGAKWGPDEMRALDTIATPDIQSLIDPLEELSVVDYGNFATDNMSTELSLKHVMAMVAETVASGAVPMMVGGDTSMLYPGVKGVAQVHGRGNFGLLHFSAHPDADPNGAHTVSDEQAIFLLLEQGIIKGSDTIQVGMRGPSVNQQTLQWLRDRKVRYHTMAEIQQQGYDKVLKRVLSETAKGPDKFFVSVDVSVLDPSEMIAAGRIAAGGMRFEQIAQTIRYVCAAKQIVGFELTDMAPVLDLSRLSVVNANALLNACLVGMAVRKSGLKADYVHPLAADHGQK